MINTVIIQGNLGQAPERVGKIVKFSIANKVGFGENVKTFWINIVTAGKTAELCEKYLEKGSSVVVDGQLQINKHDEKYYTNVFVNKIEFLSKSSLDTNVASNDSNVFF